MPDFSVDVEHVGDDIATVSIKGLLDANTFEDFDESLNDLFNNSTYKVAVDCSSLDYISSAGAGVLIGAMSVAREHGGKIVLVNPKEDVQEVFDLLGISQLFQIARDTDEAIKLLG